MVEHPRSRDVDLNNTPLTRGDLLKIDNKSETFIDHSHANGLLTRSYRKLFELPNTCDFKQGDSSVRISLVP